MARGRKRQLDLESEYWRQQIKRVDIGNDAMPAGRCGRGSERTQRPPHRSAHPSPLTTRRHRTRRSDSSAAHRTVGGRVITADQVRALALSLPQTVETDHHGRPSFRVAGKIFATLWSADQLNLMLDEAASAPQSKPGPTAAAHVSGADDWLRSKSTSASSTKAPSPNCSPTPGSTRPRSEVTPRRRSEVTPRRLNTSRLGASKGGSHPGADEASTPKVRLRATQRLGRTTAGQPSKLAMPVRSRSPAPRKAAGQTPCRHTGGVLEGPLKAPIVTLQDPCFPMDRS
jgi:hypothetical protein